MARPRRLLLDEQSLGRRSDVPEVVGAIHARGDILLVEQNVVRALEVADHVYVLEQGRVVAADVPSVLRHEPRIQEAYLGLR